MTAAVDTAETDILILIRDMPGITFNELVHTSIHSPETINRVLRLLQKEGRIESTELRRKKSKGKGKAKGWTMVK